MALNDLIHKNTIVYKIYKRNASEVDRLKMNHSIETEQLQLQVKDLKSQKQQLKAESQAELEVNAYFEAHIKLREDQIKLHDGQIQIKDSLIEAKTKALLEKDAIISRLDEQLTKSREYLATKQQVVQASITWKQCANISINLSIGQTTVINGKVYCGGGMTDDDDDRYIVYCYDPSQDNWTTLPRLPVKCFGLGHVNGKIVAVGGVRKSDGRPTNEVYTYDERSRKWMQTLPPMPTARYFPGVLSLESALVVAGGGTERGGTCNTDAVEIFKADTSQWSRTDRLPIVCRIISLVVIGNTCYALGGYNDTSHNLNQAIHASIDDLLRNAVPANQITHGGSSELEVTQSDWKTLGNTTTYQPTPAVLASNLLAIGGRETSEGGAFKKKVYMFSPSTNSWIYISDLPEPRLVPAVAVLSSTEILVIGGRRDGNSVNTTYKGALQLNL